MTEAEYLPRLIDYRLQELFYELPAMMITGPRATGKTTSAARLAKSIVRLDQPEQSQAFLDDPDAALQVYPEPVLLDEWQLAPEVLGAIKRAVDSDPRPGRFLLTGSVRARLDTPTWPGTGRVVELRMEGLTQRELTGNVDGPGFVERLRSSGLEDFPARNDAPDLVGYIDLALCGGFPETALRLSREAGKVWLDGYLEHLLTRDLDLMEEPRDPELLRRYLNALCLNTAGIPQHRSLYQAANINHLTAVRYDRLLLNLFVIVATPAWSDNRLSRLTKAAKRFLVDPALAGAALELDREDVVRDGDLMGRLLETFAVAQIRAELSLGSRQGRLYHFRDKGGAHEIDLLIEVPGGGVIAIEFKSTASPSPDHARHLIWLRDRLGERFLAGVVFHTGQHPRPLSDKIFALPLHTIWTAK